MKKYAVIVDWATDSASITEYDNKETAERAFNDAKSSGIYSERVLLVEIIDSFN